MAKSKARFLADVLQDDGSSVFVGNFAVPSDFIIDPAGSPTGLSNASLENSSITINTYTTSLGDSVTLVTDDINEGGSPTNLYFTTQRARDSFSAGTGVTITSGEVAIGQSVGTTDNVIFNQVTATVPYDNSISGLTATNVQSAITELNTLLGGGNVGSQATYNVYEYTTAGNDTQFDLSALSPAGSYIPGYVQVYLNGLLLSESDYTAVDGSTINFSPAITNAGQLLYIIAYDSFNTAEILRVTSIDASASTNSIAIDANNDVSLLGSLSFADNEKAIFGADSDLQIYHDGLNSYIDEGGTGDLFIRGGADIYLQNAVGSRTYARFTNSGDSRIYYNGALKLATTSTGIDVTGTVTADGLTVDLADNAGVLFQSPNDSSTSFLKFGDSTSNDSGSVSYDHFSDAMRFKTVNTERLRIASNGDIIFYDTAGSNAKFFWNASAESLGIGTDNPQDLLHIANTGNSPAQSTWLRVQNDAGFLFAGVTSSGDASVQSGGNLVFNTGPSYTPALTINSNLNSTFEGRITVSNSTPIFVLNDTDATNATNQIGYISFQRQGTEQSWIGYGTDTQDNFTIRNTEGSVTVDASLDVTGNSLIEGSLTLGNTTTTVGDIRLYDTGNNQLQLYGIGSNDFLVDLLGTSALGTLRFNDFLVSIDVNSGTDALTLVSSTTGTSGPQLDFTFEKAVPSNNDVVGRINFNGRDSDLNPTTYARIDGVSQVVTNGAEQGKLVVALRKDANTFENALSIEASGGINVTRRLEETTSRVVPTFMTGSLTLTGGQSYPVGWYRLARSSIQTGSSGNRGSFRVSVDSTGGSLGPGQAIITGHKDWSQTARLSSVASHGTQYFSKFKVTMDSNYAYLEGYYNGYTAPTTSSFFVTVHGDTGYYADYWFAYTENMTAGLSSPVATSDEILTYSNSRAVSVFDLNVTNEIFMAPGAGINFNAVQSTATGTTPDTGALLNDYEEGTWTPTVFSGGVGLGTIYYAKYTKIGRVVHLHCYFDISSSGTASPLVIAGLPFNSAASGYSSNAADFAKVLYSGVYARTESGNDRVYFLYSSQSTIVQRGVLEGDEIGAGYLIFSITYQTT